MAPLPTWKSSIFKYFRQGLEKVVTGWDVIQCRLGGYEIRALSVSKWPMAVLDPKQHTTDRYQRGGLTPIRIRTCDTWSPSVPIEAASVMGYPSQAVVARYTDRNDRIQLLRGSV